MNQAAAPPMSSPHSAVRGYRAAPPASRVAIAIATRRACRPALDPGASAAPHRSGTGRRNSPCPPNRTALNTRPRSNPYNKSLYSFRGLPERKARGEAGERHGWGPGGYKWRQWGHLKEDRRRTEIETQGRASVADLYE